MCSIFNIKKPYTTLYHPQSDVMVERSDKTHANMLSAYVSEHHNKWNEHLSSVMMACRSADHEAT